MMGPFASIIMVFILYLFSQKSSTLDDWKGRKYASEIDEIL